MKWFRFYSEVVDDPKVQKLPAKLFRFWVNLLCVCSMNDGELPARDALAFRIRVTPNELDESIAALEAAELVTVESGVYAIHGWNSRQYASDNVTERVKKHRSKERLVKRSGNVPVTPSDSDSDSDSDTDSDTDSEVCVSVTEVARELAPKTETHSTHPAERIDPAQRFDEGWQEYIAAFAAAGRSLTICETNEAWRCWGPLDGEQRVAAIGDAQRLAIEREGRFMPAPAKHIRERQWKRAQMQRSIPSPATQTAGMQKQSNTMRIYEELKRAARERGEE